MSAPPSLRPPAPRAEPSPRWIRVRAGGEWIAGSRRAQLVAWCGPGRLPTYAIPPEDVRDDLVGLAGGAARRMPPEDLAPGVLARSEKVTRCPYKGTASYLTPRAGDAVHPDIAWSYPDPVPECPRIAGLVAFFNERVDLVVDGEPQERPVTPWSPGGPAVSPPV